MELVLGVPFLAYVRPGPAAPSGDDEEASSVRPSVRSKEMAALAEAPEASSQAAPPAPPLGFDEKRLRAALAQLAAGLAALHRAGRVHRDIKSSNVLVTAEGRLVILDFGLIRDAEGAAGETGVVGTAHFMAPEQAAGLPVGQEADWYAVGVLLYVALTGELPFHAAPDAAMSLKQRLEPQAPVAPDRGPPPGSHELCVGLLRRDPAERLSGIEAFWRLAADEERSLDGPPGRGPSRRAWSRSATASWAAGASSRCSPRRSRRRGGARARSRSSRASRASARARSSRTSST